MCEYSAGHSSHAQPRPCNHYTFHVSCQVKWDDSSEARLFYRDRPHQAASFSAALDHAGDLEGKSVLDVGCGYGDLIPLLPGTVRYRGIDTDEQVIEEARRLHPDHEFEVTDRVRKADVVFSIGTLQCCPDPRLSLLSWISAARERLVVVTCAPWKLPGAQQEEKHWEGIAYEVFPSDDDFQTFTVRIDSLP